MNESKWHLLDTLGTDIDIEGVAARFTMKDLREILTVRRGWKRFPASKLQLAAYVWADVKLRLQRR